MRRRPLLALPLPEHVPALTALLRGEPAVEPDDPEAFAGAALHHQVAGPVLRARDDGRIGLPPAVADHLAERLAERALRTRLLCRELPGVLAAVSAATGSAPLVLKGPGLLARHYGDQPQLRPFADLDVLVPAARLDAAVDALAAAGFRELVEFAPGFGERHGHDRHVRRGQGPSRIDVELHWRVGDDPLGAGLAHGRLAPGAVPFTALGATGLAPDASAELLVLAVHLLSDRARRLIWVVDLERAATAASAADWEAAFALGDDLDLGWALDRALDYAAAHLGLARPRPRPPVAPPAWGPLRAVEELDMSVSLHLGRLAALSWRERPAYLRTILLPSRAGLADTYGRAPGEAAWRLALRHAQTALRGLRAPR